MKASGKPVVLLSWVTYDFASSAFATVIAATIYAAYYAMAVVGNTDGTGDLWWGRVVATAMAIVACTSPFLGGLADRAGVRRRLLTTFTLLSVGATALMATVKPGMPVWGFVLGVAGIVGYESALVYYNAYLPQLVRPAYQGRLSGWGFAAGSLGAMVALVVALPFVQVEAFDLAFLSTAGIFLAFALPALVLLPPERRVRLGLVQAATKGARRTLESVKEISRHRELRRFLLAYFVYSDGVATVNAFSAIFAAQTLGFQMDQLVVLYAVIQISALVGALAWSAPTDRLGPKRVLVVALCQWTAVVVLAYLVTTQTQFYAVAVLGGAGLGAVQAASRVFLSTLIPPGREAEMFGFYTLCGRMSSIVGPLVFGFVSRATGGNQRLAILTIGLAFPVGLGLLLRVRTGGPTGRTASIASTFGGQP